MAKACEKCGEMIEFISGKKGKWEPFNVKDGQMHNCRGQNPTTPPSKAISDTDRQRLIVRQSCLKVACEAWCCSNHEKKSYPATLAEIIGGMRVLEKAVFDEV